MPTRLMLAAPSIWPPPRKKASMRPCAAQSNSSRPPSVKKLLASLPRSETRSTPPERARASSAAAPGMGEDTPTATCRRPSSIRATVAMSNSSGLQGVSSGMAVSHQHRVASTNKVSPATLSQAKLVTPRKRVQIERPPALDPAFAGMTGDGNHRCNCLPANSDPWVPHIRANRDHGHSDPRRCSLSLKVDKGETAQRINGDAHERASCTHYRVPPAAAGGGVSVDLLGPGRGGGGRRAP